MNLKSLYRMDLSEKIILKMDSIKIMFEIMLKFYRLYFFKILSISRFVSNLKRFILCIYCFHIHILSDQITSSNINRTLISNIYETDQL